ncbi:hypothetical protein [Bradyrhizobium sp. 170]|uniref:hypothetical protein n=1 Tax=Bradyrhizobium sp. 170 TaxID=2782641 RepID=UPI001FFF2D5E|nr:hypothetical protein [Bradyrhizobium sp. 170]UPK08524.1 hypothetical protein IVB05_20635 [Bradyrhizobium sp. 170]
MMHGPLPDQQDHSEAATGKPLVAALGQALALCNRVIEVIWGTLAFVLLMMLAVLLLCFFPGISTWLPDLVMGSDGR